jgi:MbtH protein
MSTEPVYRVIVDAQDRYSLWPLHKDGVAGWRDTSITGTREHCLAEVRQAWTDMRPKSLRT